MPRRAMSPGTPAIFKGWSGSGSPASTRARSLAGKRDLRTYAHRQPANYNFISVNVQHPNLRDIRVRQAIRYAIDVPALIAVQGESLSTRIYGCIPPELPSGYWPDAPRYN